MDFEQTLALYRKIRTYEPEGDTCKCGNAAELWDEMLEEDYCTDCWEELHIEKLGRKWPA